MWLGLLGPLSVKSGGKVVEIGSSKQRAVLCLLALREGEVVRSETLIEGLWADDPPASASKTLQTYISSLRRVLPIGAIRTSAGG
ncbi:MAG TPA: winged helix-turn-helix domain-containing protein [Acidimicrobiales bacterium]|nr:winged helix-turn-helix domain-containing protein [Acidimicrobiales bacterium]